MKIGHRLTLLLLFFLLLPLPAQQLVLEAEVGLRTERFDWSIADVDGSPNVLSELTWRDLRFTTLGLTAHYQLGPRLLLLGQLEYGQAHDGEVQDSDFLADHRTGEFLRSISSADGSELLGISAAIGVPLERVSQHWRLRAMPLAGLFRSSQRLRITDGVWIIPEAGGEIAGLDSRYDADWFGPWLGLELAAENVDGYGLSLMLARYAADYEADAYWNLRDTPAAGQYCLRRFEQWADGDGTRVALSGHYRFDRWRLVTTLSWSEWDTDTGTDRIYFCDGTVGDTRFNGARRESTSVAVGVGYDF